MIVPVRIVENTAYATAASKNEELEKAVNFWLTYVYEEYDANKEVIKLLYKTHQVSKKIILKLGNNQKQEVQKIPIQRLKRVIIE